VDRWFQNTRGLVIIGLAIATVVVLLSIEPDDSFPGGFAVSSGTTPSGAPITTVPGGTSSGTGSTTTTTVVRPTVQEGSTGADVTVLQQRLNALGYNVGTPDGVFGAGTKAQVIAFQTQKGISPADGVVNQATWTALLATE